MSISGPAVFGILAFLAAAIGSPATGGEELSVPLKVTEPVGVKRAGAPVTGGVPVEPLGVKDVKELILVGADGQAVAAQMTPTVKAEDGRLIWVLVEFLTDLDAGKAREYVLRRVAAGEAARPPVAKPVTVDQTDEAVTLANGVVKAAISRKKFNLLDGVWLDRDGDGKFGDDERMLAPEQPDALTFTDVKDGAAYSAHTGTVQAVTVEDAGPVRATVRADGDFARVEGGEKRLKYTVRVTLWAGRPDIKVQYAIRNTNPDRTVDEHIKRATLAFKLAEPTGIRHYLVGAGQTRMSQINPDEKDAMKRSQWHHAVQLAQVGPPEQVCSKTHRQFYALAPFEDAGYRVYQFQPSNRRPIADVGLSCQGWMDLAGDKGGCQLWMRSFANDTPKRMEARADGSMSVDVIPEFAGRGQPYYSDGGYWLADRSHRTYEFNLRFHGKPLLTEADWKTWREGFFNFSPPTPETAARAEAVVEEAHHPLQLASTPEWYTRTGELWGVMPSLAEEAAANRALGRTKEGPVRGPQATHVGTEFMHYDNFHYRSESDEPQDALIEFLRTGDWNTFRRANSFARNYRDLGVWRTDGQSFGKRAGGPRAPQAVAPTPGWGKFDECHHYGAGLIDMWLITGDRSYLDAGLEWGRVMAGSPGAYGGYGDRHWGRKMAAVLAAYKATRERALKEWLAKYCRPPVPDEKLRADGRGLLCGKHQSSWMVGLCTHAAWHNYVLNRDTYSGVELDDFEDGIVGVARNIAKYYFQEKTRTAPYNLTFDDPEPGKIHSAEGDTAYSASVVDSVTRGYLLTGDKKLLEAAKLYWDCVNGNDKTTVSGRLQDFQGMGANTFWARQLVYELAHPRKDAESPEPVKDLAAEALGGGKVRLTWTAPGDRGGGSVAAYQVKHAPLPIVTFEEYQYPEDSGKKWTWWAGYNVAGEPKPAAAGSRESWVAEGIPAGTRHIRLVARDDSRNESEMSNDVAVDVR